MSATTATLEREIIFSWAKTLRGNPRMRAIDYLVKKYGDTCFYCKTKLPDAYKADVDHFNGINKPPHVSSNLRLSCHSCNSKVSNTPSTSITVEREISGSLAPATERLQNEVNYESGSPEMQVMGRCELPFRNFVASNLIRDGYMNWANAVFGGADSVGCSPSTTERYLRKASLPFNLKGIFKRHHNTTSKKFEVRPNLDNPFWKDWEARRELAKEMQELEG